MDKKDQQKLITWIAIKAILIIWLIFVIYYFIVPNYLLFYENIKKINLINKELKDVKESWFTLESLKPVLSKNIWDKSIITLLDQKDKIKDIITKPSKYTWNYVAWIQEELLKEVDFTKEIETNNKIIWNVIPIFIDYYDNPNSKNIVWDIKNKITVDTFIAYIEDQIYKKYNLESYVSLWIKDITFDNNDSNIWSFKIDIDIDWTNSSIKNLLKNIYESWKLNIKEWKLLQNSSLSNNTLLWNNLLITIEKLNLDNLFDSKDNLNKWKMSLRFYVRWIWFDYFVKIKSKVQQEFDDLLKNIEEKSSFCDKKSAACNDDKIKEAVSNIKLLNSEINGVKGILDEFNKKITILNFKKEIDNLFKIYSSILTIKSKFEKDNDIITKIK